MNEKELDIELMKGVESLISEKVDNYLKDNNLKDPEHENSDRLTNLLREGIKNELETNFSVEDKLDLLNDKQLFNNSIENGINTLIELESREFNDAWGKVSDGISKEDKTNSSKEEIVGQRFNGPDEELDKSSSKSKEKEIDFDKNSEISSKR